MMDCGADGKGEMAVQEQKGEERVPVRLESERERRRECCAMYEWRW